MANRKRNIQNRLLSSVWENTHDRCKTRSIEKNSAFF